MKPKHVTIIADNLEEAIQEALCELKREYGGNLLISFSSFKRFERLTLDNMSIAFTFTLPRGFANE